MVHSFMNSKNLLFVQKLDTSDLVQLHQQGGVSSVLLITGTILIVTKPPGLCIYTDKAYYIITHGMNKRGGD